jgi:hypothetical protein
MRLALTIPSSGALPELHDYYCKECGVMVLRRTEWRRAAQPGGMVLGLG